MNQIELLCGKIALLSRRPLSWLAALRLDHDYKAGWQHCVDHDYKTAKDMLAVEPWQTPSVP